MTDTSGADGQMPCGSSWSRRFIHGGVIAQRQLVKRTLVGVSTINSCLRNGVHACIGRDS